MSTNRFDLCLWFDDQAERAAAFYTGIFKNSRIVEVTRFSHVGQEHHGKPPGSVQTVQVELDGARYTLLNGGPLFKFSEAISIQINCVDQAEVDYYWERLTEGGDPSAQVCGWLKDKFGVSWQVVPQRLYELTRDHTSPKAQRAMQAMFEMTKIDVAVLEAAYAAG
jgi:predicted 3-demethylubiquinone-9 3-methyltransferase (glyoxalase superfamily)